MAAIVLRDVSKRYGAVEAIHDVSLEIAASEFLVCVGPSGCGKSTLIRLIAGFETPTAGDILFDGVRVNDRPANRRGVAMVFQNYALYPHMTARDNIAFGLRNQGLAEPEVCKRVQDVAEIVAIDSLLDRRPDSLSGGQRQRVAIGRAIARRPQVFLFDEPLSNLDAGLRSHMRVELARLHQRFPVSTVYVTHDQIEAMTLADRLAVLNEGRLEQVGPPLQLYRRPKNLFIATFLGSPPMNRFAGTVHRAGAGHTEVRLQTGALLASGADARGLARGDDVVAGIRPEHLIMTPSRQGLPCRLDVVERLGSRTLLYCTAAPASPAETPCVAEWTEPEAGPPGAPIGRLRPGDRLFMAATPEHVHLFDHQGDALPFLGLFETAGGWT